MTEQSQEQEVLQQFDTRKILWAVFIGIAVIAIFFFRDFDPSKLNEIEFNNNSAIWLFIALVAVVVRHILFMWRLKVLTDDEFSWKQCFQIISLWEFSSTVTPSAVGGTAVAFPLLNREGINLGRTTAIVLITIFLDGLFFTFVLGGLWLYFGSDLISSQIGGEKESWRWAFFVGFFGNITYFLIIAYGLFVNPKTLKWLIEKFFTLPFIRRWKESGIKAGQDILVASAQLKDKSWSYWINSFLGTAGGWIARLAIVNFVLLSVSTIANHFFIFARSIMIFLSMVLAITPGSSGGAELAFVTILNDFIPEGIGPVLALIWRLLTYYIYLPLGFVILPIWVRRVFKNRKNKEATN